MITPVRILLSALALTGWAGAAEAQPVPGRGEVEAAVNRWFACGTGADCRSLLRRRLTSARCQRLPVDPANPGRILCVFSGADFRGGRVVSRFRDDCAYLVPDRRGWRVSALPDADICG